MNRIPCVPASILVALALGAAASADAQTVVERLHSFAGFTGREPRGGVLLASDGNLYGTTEKGGAFGSGTIFRISPSGVHTLLYSFRTTAETGVQPVRGLVEASDHNFYGTTVFGIGNPGRGTVFRMTPAGVVTFLHTFQGGSDGDLPASELLRAADGHLYGVTEKGGAFGFGTIFRVTLAGVVTVVHSFTGGGGGSSPVAALAQGGDGRLYGTTYSGGNAEDAGTIFAFAPDGTFETLHVFSGEDGRRPSFPLVLGPDGHFYGNTPAGGDPTFGGGVAFRITTAGVFSLLRTFSENGVAPVGSFPSTPFLLAPDGTFYGVNSSPGLLFKMTTSGAVTPVGIFEAADGIYPTGRLARTNDGRVWGTAWLGGAADCGTAFTVSESNQFTRLFSFCDASEPSAPLLRASDGNFYGTSPQGGAFNQGAVFKLTLAGAVTILHSFTGGTGGGTPLGSLVEAPDGYFYGTTSNGGANGVGTIFRISSAGGLSISHSFAQNSPANGSHPSSALIIGNDGHLYGTTIDGGAAGLGTVFRITTAAAFTTLYSFSGAPDGVQPAGALLKGADGAFYGTTRMGGASNSGTVFRITAAGALTILHSFSGGDGARPEAALTTASDGTFYGTTTLGGSANLGTVFAITPSGSFRLVQSFTGTNGSTPHAALTLSPTQSLWGVTTAGGTQNGGVVFRVARDGSSTQVLHSLVPATEGESPGGALAADTDGRWYGTARLGGLHGHGSIFRLRSAAFTDDPLLASVSIIRAVHITELRSRVDALRAARKLPVYAWTDSALAESVTVVRSFHVAELRDALSAAYVADGLPAPSFTDPSLSGIVVKAIHLTELRRAVAALE